MTDEQPQERKERDRTISTRRKRMMDEVQRRLGDGAGHTAQHFSKNPVKKDGENGWWIYRSGRLLWCPKNVTIDHVISALKNPLDPTEKIPVHERAPKMTLGEDGRPVEAGGRRRKTQDPEEKFLYFMRMKGRHRKVLEAIYETAVGVSVMKDDEKVYEQKPDTQCLLWLADKFYGKPAPKKPGEGKTKKIDVNVKDAGE